MRATAAASDFAVDPHSVAQGKASHDFRGDKDILRRLDKIAFRIAQKAEAFAGNFNDALAEFRFDLDLFAGFASALSGFSACRAGLIESLDSDISAGVIGVYGRRIWRFLGITGPKPLAAVTSSRESTARTRMALLRRSGLSFQRRRLVFVFFVHKLRWFAAGGGQRPKGLVSSSFSGRQLGQQFVGNI